MPDVELFQACQREISDACTGARESVEQDGFWESVIFADQAVYVCWKEHFEFVVSADGRRVLWRRLRPVSDEVLFTYLLGQVLSHCLLARGIEPLHATAVVVNEEAIAFLGNSGAGKSTLAAVFLGKSCALLTDDVLVLEIQGKEVMAHPGLPRIKLVPEAADAFLCGRRSIPMNAFTSKMIFALDAVHHSAKRVPLRALYVLPKKPTTSRILMRRMHGRASFLPLIHNTFNSSVLSRWRLKQQFAHAHKLAESIPIKQLSYPRGLEVLPAVTDVILSDLAGESSAQ
ncbi:MAG: hypothetical protein ACE14M_06070 [Terriglobales bacterium]